MNSKTLKINIREITPFLIWDILMQVLKFKGFT